MEVSLAIWVLLAIVCPLGSGTPVFCPKGRVSTMYTVPVCKKC